MRSSGMLQSGLSGNRMPGKSGSTPPLRVQGLRSMQIAWRRTSSTTRFRMPSCTAAMPHRSRFPPSGKGRRHARSKYRTMAKGSGRRTRSEFSSDDSGGTAGWALSCPGDPQHNHDRDPANRHPGQRSEVRDPYPSPGIPTRFHSGWEAIKRTASESNIYSIVLNLSFVKKIYIISRFTISKRSLERGR